MRFRMAILASMAVVLVGMFSGRGVADPANKGTLEVTLHCGSHGDVDVVYEYSGTDSFHVTSTTSNYLWKSLTFEDPNGTVITIERGIKGNGHDDLVTC